MFHQHIKQQKYTSFFIKPEYVLLIYIHNAGADPGFQVRGGGGGGGGGRT